MRSRASRRQQLVRMKRKARRVYPMMLCPEKLANHLKCCSCWMCGNARKLWKHKTRQEVMAEEDAEEQINQMQS